MSRVAILPVLLALQTACSSAPSVQVDRTPLADSVIVALEALAKEDPSMKEGRIWEALADAYVVRSGFSRGKEVRADYLKKAEHIYARLSMRLGPSRFDEAMYRTLWKRTLVLSELDPEILEVLFRNVTLRGVAPTWDEDANGKSRWGYRDKLEALRPKP